MCQTYNIKASLTGRRAGAETSSCPARRGEKNEEVLQENEKAAQQEPGCDREDLFQLIYF